MTPEELRPLVLIQNGCAIVIAMLVDELDKRGSLSKSEFIDLLTNTAEEARKGTPKGFEALPRFDLQILTGAADYLRDPGPRGGWIPRVIEGGKEDDNSR